MNGNPEPTPRLLAEGTSADLLAWGPARVLKRFRPSAPAHALEAERTALLRAARAGIAVPSLHGSVNMAGQAGLIMSWHTESTLLAHLVRRPWQAPALLARMAAVQRRIHGLPGDGLPDQKARVRALIERAPLPAHHDDRVRRCLDRLPDGDGLCHGDMHLGNVLVTRDDLLVLDWEKACRGRPAGDLARTLVLLRHGAWSTRMPATLVELGRRTLARQYRRAFDQAGRTVDPRELGDWITVMTAAKLAFASDTSAPHLLRTIDRYLR